MVIDCVSALGNTQCVESLNDTEAFYFNSSCHKGSAFNQLQEFMAENQSATTQFFEYVFNNF